MSEPTADDLTRQAVLGALVESAKKKEEPKKSSGVSFDEKTSFGSLLEESLNRRVELAEKDLVSNDEDRKKAIKESNVDMVGDLMKRLL
jgi:hypothetical protein